MNEEDMDETKELATITTRVANQNATTMTTTTTTTYDQYLPEAMELRHFAIIKFISEAICYRRQVVG